MNLASHFEFCLLSDWSHWGVNVVYCGKQNVIMQKAANERYLIAVCNHPNI